MQSTVTGTFSVSLGKNGF